MPEVPMFLYRDRDGKYITTDPSPTLLGQAEPNATIEVSLDGVVHGTTPSDGSGNWTYKFIDLADGDYQVRAVTIDAVGIRSSSSLPLTLTIDTIPPPVPVITIPHDGAVLNRLETIAGTSEPFSLVAIYIDGVLLGSLITASGVWSVDPFIGLAEGHHTIAVRARDSAMHESDFSQDINFEIDLTAPDAPIITSPSDGNLGNVNTPSIRGTAEAGATVSIRINGVEDGTVLADAAGEWSYTTSLLPDGNYSIQTTATDPAGNESAPSLAITIEIDTEAPDAPLITAPLNNSFTNNRTLEIRGQAEAGTDVRISINGDVQGTVKADGVGMWSYTTLMLAEGTYAISATAADTVGNISSVSALVELTIDTTEPDVPVIGLPKHGTSTNNQMLEVSGSAERDSFVRILLNNTEQGTVKADSKGNWSYTSAALPDGDHEFSARATDAAGNVSELSKIVAVTIDTLAPPAPLIVTEENVLLYVPRPEIEGKAEENTLVTVFVNGAAHGTTTSLGGDWSYIPVSDLRGGDSIISAVATDVAGNTSVFSSEVILRIIYDQDNDGIPDDEEERLGTDPYSDDSDGDGVSDHQELLDGTDPLDRGSVLTILPSTICAE